MKSDPQMKEAAIGMLKKIGGIPMDKVTGVSLSLVLGKPKRPKEEHHAEDKEDDSPQDGLESGIAELLENWTERDEETDAGKYYHDLKRLAGSHGIEVDGKEGEEEEEEQTHNSHDEGEDY